MRSSLLEEMFGSLPVDISAVILISTLHLRKKSGKIGRTATSILLLLLIALNIDMKSSHMCDEGSAPFFVKYGFGMCGAALPWLLPSHPWITRGAVIPTILIGVFVARFLTASYHRDDITGNRAYSSGRFWHTPFTGQFQRDPNMTFERRQAERERIIREIENSEQNAAGQPATRPLSE